VKDFSLRDYQWDAVLDLSSYLMDGYQSVALISPTGSGKSLTILTILKRLLGGSFKSAVIATPFIQIEDGFHRDCRIFREPPSVPGTSSRISYTIHKDEFFLRPRGERDIPTRESLEMFLSADSPAEPVFLTTHHQLAREGGLLAPKDLSGRILVVDEAHHSKMTDTEFTKIGAFIRWWIRCGGAVLFVTATPFRADGGCVFPEDTKIHLRPLTKHSSAGYAPNNFEIRMEVLPDSQASTPEQLKGEALPSKEDKKGASPLAMASRWRDDQKPKAVFIVPSINSLQWTSRLIEALREIDPGCRIVDAVGVGTEVQKNLLKFLDPERNVENYEDSQVDVILACRRFDEGTDWPLCSHIYNYGLPRSFGLIVQRWGRSFRMKKPDPITGEGGIKKHPHADTSCITFFVPQVKEEVLEQFERQHHDHAFLLACYMADWKTAQSYGSELRIRFEKHFKRMREWEKNTELENIRSAQSFEISDEVRAEIQTLLNKWAVGFKSCTGKDPTFQEGQTYLQSLELDEMQDQAAGEILMSMLVSDKPEILDEVEDALAAMQRVRREDLRKVFHEIVSKYRTQTLRIPGNVLSVYSSFTGQDAGDVARKLAANAVKPPLTNTKIDDAMLAYYHDHGTAPTEKSGDATLYFGYPETWSAVGSASRKKSRGLDDE